MFEETTPLCVKDANDLLQVGELSAAKQQVLAAIAAAVPMATSKQPREQGDVEPVLIRLSDVACTQLKWLWPGRIPEGSLTLIAGDPGLGKSTVTTDIAARVTSGATWPDGALNDRPGDVLMITAEDDLGNTVRPRFEAAGGTASRVLILDATMRNNREELFSLESGIPALEAAVVQMKDARLVIIDPISAYLGNTDSHRDASVRGLLRPLMVIASRHNVAIVMVGHLNKSATGSALQRTMGSIAFTAAARMSLLVAKDKGEPERRLFLQTKNNLSSETKGLAFKVQPSKDNAAIGTVHWENVDNLPSADEALAQDTDPDARYALTDATSWLREALADGPLPTKEVQKLGKESGHSAMTLRRAADSLGVRRVKSGRACWHWELNLEGAQPPASTNKNSLSIFQETHLNASPSHSFEDAHQKSMSTFQLTHLNASPSHSFEDAHPRSDGEEASSEP